MIKKYSLALRSSEWWNTKMPLLLGIFLCFSIDNLNKPAVTMLHLVLALIWTFSAAGFGYFLNDCFDIQVDAITGKANQSTGLSLTQRALVLLFLGTVALLSVSFIGNPFLVFIAFLHLLLFFVYSAPPLRFKNVLLVGLLVDAIYAWVLPIIIIMIIANVRQLSFFYFSAIWAFFAGFKSILQHHVADRHIDTYSGVFNAANRFKTKTAIFFIQLSFVLEIVSFACLLAFTLPLPLLYSLCGLFPLFLTFNFLSITVKRFTWTFKSRWRTGKIHINRFYEDWLPLVLILYFIFQAYQFIILGGLYLILFRYESIRKVAVKAYWIIYKGIYRFAMFLFYRGLYPVFMFLFYRIMYPMAMFLVYRIGFPFFILFRYKFYHFLRKTFLWILNFIYYKVLVQGYHHVFLRFMWWLYSMASLSVNYPIYYFRRIILGRNDREARKMTEEQYRDYLAMKNAPKSRKVKDEIVTQAPSPTVVRPVINLDQPNNDGGMANGQRSVQPSDVNTVLTNVAIAKTYPTPLFIDAPPDATNKIVHGLWIGEELSALEMLTLHSFTSNGHAFHLWTYGPLKNNLPLGVVINDANEIIPYSKVFRYKNKNKFGHGKGSVSGFSDIFRYKLLYEKGGWWVDMDVTCLQPLNLTAPYFFRKHHDLMLVGNVMKCPAKSSLMKDCFEEAIQTIDENNKDWHKPIEILNKYVAQYELEPYINDLISNEDKWMDVRKYINRNSNPPRKYRIIHWMNEEWRSRGLDKNDIRYNSILGKLMIKYGLISLPKDNYSILLNDLRHLVFEFMSPSHF